MPVFLGGIMLGCDALHAGRPLRVAHLFDGFRGPHFVPLLLDRRVQPAAVRADGRRRRHRARRRPRHVRVDESHRPPRRSMGVVAQRSDSPICCSSSSRWSAFALFATANWFAPTLIVLRGAKAFAAMTASVRASFRNWLPFLVYGLIGAGILIVAMAVFAALAGAIGYEAIVAMVMSGAGWEAVHTRHGFADRCVRGTRPCRFGRGLRLDLCKLSRHARSRSCRDQKRRRSEERPLGAALSGQRSVLQLSALRPSWRRYRRRRPAARAATRRCS